MKINLNRISTNFEQNTCHGTMFLDGQEIAKTLELPYKQNEHSISSIPTGIYTCRRIESPKFGEVFEVLDVPNRSDILLHWGNFPRDTHGCVLIGEEFGEIEGQDAILNSHKAFRNFMTMLSGVNEFELEIK